MRMKVSRFRPWAWCALVPLAAGCRAAGDADGEPLASRAAQAMVARVPAAAPGGPPPGRYVCWIRGAASAGAGGFRLLPEGRYQPAAGSGGVYGYDAGTRTLSFRGGTFASYDWVGVYLAAEGAANTGETVVLKDRSDARVPGAEGAGEFQYCYRSAHPDDQ